MKKILLSIIIFCLCGSLLAQEKILKNKIIYPGDVKAKAILLMDMDSKKILYGKKIYFPFPNASTTKLLTAIVACENLQPGDTLTVSKKASETSFNSMDFTEGETISMEDCLGAMLIRSANDAAVVLGENVAGSVENFVQMMNEKAYSIGCFNTYFVTPNGLHNPKHHSTCYDLALMGIYAKKIPLIDKYLNSKGFEITSRSNPKGLREIKSTSRYVLEYPYSTGAKSGYTSYAGNCLVCTGTKDGKNLILVILNTNKNIYNYMSGIMNWGFENPDKNIIEY